MKAAIYRREGAAQEVLEVTDVGTPGPGPGEVRVRMAMSAINPTDVKIRAGVTARPIEGFQVPHMDGAGTIDAVGAGVALDRVGERVWVMFAAHQNQWGTAARNCVVSADRAIPLGDADSFTLGASLGVPAVTAAHALLADGPIEGEDVLIAGGAGAVGRAAIQLAKHLGARVIATASTPEKQEIARAAGADLVVDYRKDGAADEIRAFTPGVQRVVELDLARNLELDLAVLRPGGDIVVYAIDGPDPALPVRACMMANVRISFMLLYTLSKVQLSAAIDAVQGALAAGALDVLVDATYSMDDIVAAHQRQEAGPTGRVMVEIS
jgi:NADPH2:quinone reductase